MAKDIELNLRLAMVDKVTGVLGRVNKTSLDTAKGLKAARDTLKQLNAQLGQVDNLKKQQAALAQQGSALKVLRTNLDSVTRTYGANSAEAAKLQGQVNKATAAYEKQRGALVQLRTAATNSGIGKLSTSEATLRASIAKTTAEMEKKSAAMRRQGEQHRKLSEMQERQSKAAMRSAATMGAGYGAMQAGRTAGRATAGLLGKGVEFDATMSRVQALTRLQKNNAELAALRQQAKDLGDSTMFSATEAAQGQGFLAMAGFKPQQIMGAMPGMLDMAKAGDMEIGRTADISSNILSAFGIDPNNMGHVADVLTKTFTTSNTTLEMLGNTMSYVGPVARAAGVDLETTAAMAGLLGNVGIQSEKAGTAMRAMLLRLAAPTSTAAKTLQELGVSTKDLKGDIKPIIPLLAEIAAKTEKMGSGDQMEALKSIFGEEPAAAMTEIIKKAGSNGIIEYLNIVRDNQGAAGKTAKIMADNMRGSLDELSSAWDTVWITVDELNEGWMRPVVDSITEVVRGVTGWIAKNPILVNALTMLAVALSAVLAAGGALLIGLGLIIGKSMFMRFVIARLAMALTPLAGPILGGLVAGLKMAASAVLFIGRALLMTPIGLLVTGIAVAAFLIYKYWGPITAFFGRIWAAISSGLATAGTFIRDTFNNVMTYLAGLPARFLQFGADMMSGLVNGILGKIAAVRDAITGAADGAIGWFREKLGIRSPSRVFMESGTHIVQGAAQGIDRTLPMLRAAALGMAGATAVAMPAMSASIDTRAPLTAAGARGGGATTVQGDTITIHITAAAGTDANALAGAIRAELDRRAAAKNARMRAAFTDYDN